MASCDAVPVESERKVCQDVINKYFPLLWAKILTFMDSKKICTDLKLCSSDSFMAVSFTENFSIVGPNYALWCPVIKIIWETPKTTINWSAKLQKLAGQYLLLLYVLVFSEYISHTSASSWANVRKFSRTFLVGQGQPNGKSGLQFLQDSLHMVRS